MEARQIYRFVEEFRQQCRFAQIAFQGMNTELHALNSEKTLFYVEAFLSHSVNAADLLWPSREASKERGNELRQALKTTDTLNQALKEIRQQMGRPDEHYEDWLLSLPEAGYVDRNIMPQGTTAGYQQDTFQRSLDPDTLRLELRSTPAELKTISDEIKKLELNANQWLKIHHPW